jgi:NADH-quinone oxidoreductase subunit N
VAPLLVLSAGVVLYLLCDVVLGQLRAMREVVFAAAIACAAVAEWRVLAHPPGSVLYGTFVANQATALWGFLFLLATLLAWIHGHGYYRENLPFKTRARRAPAHRARGHDAHGRRGDLIVFFVGLELLSIPLYALCAFRRSRSASVEAGMKYFLLGSFASAIFLYGAALLYAGTGTLALEPLAQRDLGSPLARSGLALVAASLFFKAAVFPFQWWAPDVYQGSPTPVTGLMATGTKAAAFAFLVVQVTPLLPASDAPVVMALALVTMAIGNLGALVQSDLKRMLAYSSVAHAGNLLLLVAAGMGHPDQHGALRAALYYLGGYLFTAMGAFGLVARLEITGARSTELSALRGLARRVR